MSEPADVETIEGARAWFDQIKADAKRVIEELGEHLPMALFGVNRDVKTGATLPAPGLLIVGIDTAFMKDGDTKNDLRKLIWTHCRLHEAFAYCFISEVWVRQLRSEKERDEYAAQPTSLNDDSQKDLREEHLMLAGEHRALGAAHFLAEIKRWKPGARPRLDPWQDMSDIAKGGRFSGLLPKKEELAMLEQRWRALVDGCREMKIGKEEMIGQAQKAMHEMTGDHEDTWLAELFINRLKEADL